LSWSGTFILRRGSRERQTKERNGDAEQSG
jgi:hypothetical protein